MFLFFFSFIWVISNISRGINRSLHGGKNGRSWEKLLGFDAEQLIRYIEKQFAIGMSWDNYGTRWHVDHKKPISSFIFSSPDDAGFKECWNLRNLQPLWAKENLKKGSSITCSGGEVR